MDHRPLGETGLKLSAVGFGSFKIGRNVKTKYPGDYSLPSDRAADNLLNEILDLGINYIDTAPAYGLAEQRIGSAIGRRRDEFVLSTKVGETFDTATGASAYDYSAESVRTSLENSLRRLQTEAIDITFIHCNDRDLEIQRDEGIVDALRQAKVDGLTRLIGLSGKTVAGARFALAWADVLMVAYHARDRSHAGVMSEARERGIGVVVKKGLDSGHLEPAEAIPFVLEHRAASSLVIGSCNLGHLRANLALAGAVQP